MIQLLIGLGIILGIFLMVFLPGVFVIFLKNTFTTNEDYYTFYVIMYYGIRCLGVLLAVIIGLSLIWILGDVILLNFK